MLVINEDGKAEKAKSRITLLRMSCPRCGHECEVTQEEIIETGEIIYFSMICTNKHCKFKRVIV